MAVWSCTENIQKFYTTQTTTNYHSRRCKENSILPQIDIKFVLFRYLEQKLWLFKVLLKTYTNFELQTLLHTTIVGIVKKIKFFPKSI